MTKAAKFHRLLLEQNKISATSMYGLTRASNQHMAARTFNHWLSRNRRAAFMPSQRGTAVMMRNACRFSLGTISLDIADGDNEWLAT